ncbi:MAG: DUF3572 domain-containing protein [Pseudolabrys sp.]|nr:DUF3572 domain-containing protein [Pseudolabrys sp.]MBV9955946.1 DUF3572 domain-containing protein [Pseudolabrys sp.]
MKQRSPGAQDAAEALAIQALTFIAADGERLGTFLALTGIGPGDIRAAAREPGFLAGVLDHVSSNEQLLRDFAAEAGVPPETIGKARSALGGGDWEREIP